MPSDGIFRRPPTRQKPRASPLGDTPYTVRRGKTDRPSEKPDFVFRRPLPLR
ncbi:hypothetical protein [Kingella potus]|uniref:hypothetical protein n=1 Tax=Kingella potus TaxID=265175 RepID=UPI001FD45BD0|nr:hypothetical protein [Kingella potus]UOP01065.1 hypothetical protein LVJ84_01480 [Kingella potus]